MSVSRICLRDMLASGAANGKCWMVGSQWRQIWTDAKTLRF